MGKGTSLPTVPLARARARRGALEDYSVRAGGLKFVRWISPFRVKKQPHDQRLASTSRRTPLENANPSGGGLSIDLENDLENDLSANIRHRRGR